MVDTNFVGRGNFNRDQIERMQHRLAQRGHSLVVPEVVVWEWAEHAHRAMVDATDALERVAKRVDPLLRPGWANPIEEVESLATQIAQAINALDHATVMDTPPGAFAEGIKAQVMQTGVAHRVFVKEGVSDGKAVKTGAADHLVLATVEGLLSGGEQVVLCTGDARLIEVVERDLAEVIIARTPQDLWHWFGTTPPQSAQLAQLLTTLVATRLERSVADHDFFPLFENGRSIDGRTVYGWAPEIYQVDVEVSDVQEVEVADLEIVEVAPPFVTGVIWAKATLDTMVWVFGDDADLIHIDDTVLASLSVSFSADLDEEWTPTDFRTEDRCEIFVE